MAFPIDDNGRQGRRNDDGQCRWAVIGLTAVLAALLGSGGCLAYWKQNDFGKKVIDLEIRPEWRRFVETNLEAEARLGLSEMGYPPDLPLGSMELNWVRYSPSDDRTFRVASTQAKLRPPAQVPKESPAAAPTKPVFVAVGWQWKGKAAPGVDEWVPSRHARPRVVPPVSTNRAAR